jgi:hypothetical protein
MHAPIYAELQTVISTAGSPATVTITPGAGRRVFLRKVLASYSGAGTGLLTVQEGATTVLQHQVVNSDQVDLNLGMKEGQNVVITLAGLTGLQAVLTVVYNFV